jgi:uncharacterized protein (TIGR02391 family)
MAPSEKAEKQQQQNSLDLKLLKKTAGRLKLSEKSLREKISRRASGEAVSKHIALELIARENLVPTAHHFQKLSIDDQRQVREMLPSIFAPQPKAKTPTGKKQQKAASPSSRDRLKAAIEYVIEDPELRDRCTDILLASSKFDRPINQATQVLEDRIRKKSAPTSRLVGEPLVNFAFKEDVSTTVLLVPSNDPDDQRGFTQILRGVVPAFRNKTHHHIIDKFSREDALRVCGFIDVLLRVVDSSTKIK